MPVPSPVEALVLIAFLAVYVRWLLPAMVAAQERRRARAVEMVRVLVEARQAVRDARTAQVATTAVPAVPMGELIMFPEPSPSTVAAAKRRRAA